MQQDGTFFEWPKSNGVCDPNLPADYKYNPRIRPWYAVPVSGPKDVMIVIDKSKELLISIQVTSIQIHLSPSVLVKIWGGVCLYLFRGVSMAL